MASAKGTSRDSPDALNATANELCRSVISGNIGRKVASWPDWPPLAELAEAALPAWKIVIATGCPQASVLVVKVPNKGSTDYRVFGAEGKKELELLLRSIVLPAAERVMANFVSQLPAEEVQQQVPSECLDHESWIRDRLDEIVRDVHSELAKSVRQAVMHCRQARLVGDDFHLEEPHIPIVPEGSLAW